MYVLSYCVQIGNPTELFRFGIAEIYTDIRIYTPINNEGRGSYTICSHKENSRVVAKFSENKIFAEDFFNQDQ